MQATFSHTFIQHFTYFTSISIQNFNNPNSRVFGLWEKTQDKGRVCKLPTERPQLTDKFEPETFLLRVLTPIMHNSMTTCLILC